MSAIETIERILAADAAARSEDHRGAAAEIAVRMRSLGYLPVPVHELADLIAAGLLAEDALGLSATEASRIAMRIAASMESHGHRFIFGDGGDAASRPEG